MLRRSYHFGMFTLLTSVATLIVGIVLTYSFNSFQTRKAFRLQKVEELFIALATHRNSVSRSLQYAFNVATREDHENVIKPDESNREKSENEYERLVMFTNVYFPSLIPSLEAIEGVKNQWVKLTGEYHRNEIPNDEFAETMGALMLLFNNVCGRMKADIVLLASDINAEMPFGIHKLKIWIADQCN